MSQGIFHAYGLFWRRDEINWNPGYGTRNEFRLLGRQGWNRGSLRCADFRHQNGIYILYGDLGPYYVGLTRAQGIGKRLKDHCFDKHRSQWDRFSWFSFGKVLKSKDSEGLQNFGEVPSFKLTQPGSMIGDIEALLIKAMALRNVANMKFARAELWHQVKAHQIDEVVKKLPKRIHA